jgi:hypothetical protein
VKEKIGTTGLNQEFGPTKIVKTVCFWQNHDRRWSKTDKTWLKTEVNFAVENLAQSRFMTRAHECVGAKLLFIAQQFAYCRLMFLPIRPGRFLASSRGRSPNYIASRGFHGCHSTKRFRLLFSRHLSSPITDTTTLDGIMNYNFVSRTAAYHGRTRFFRRET